MQNLTTSHSVPEEDWNIIYHPKTILSLAHGRPPSLFVSVTDEENGQSRLMLPQWVEALLSAMRIKYGEPYYSFAVNHILEGLLKSNKIEGLTSNEANQFQMAVNSLMQNPGERLH